jgi:hypothetical protein
VQAHRRLSFTAQVNPEALPTGDRLFGEVADVVGTGPLLNLSQMSGRVGPFRTVHRKAVGGCGLNFGSSHANSFTRGNVASVKPKIGQSSVKTVAEGKNKEEIKGKSGMVGAVRQKLPVREFSQIAREEWGWRSFPRRATPAGQ